MSQAWPVICQKVNGPPCSTFADSAPAHSKLKRRVSARARSGSGTGLAGSAGGQAPAASDEATAFRVARRNGPLRTGTSVPAAGTRMARSVRMPGPSQSSLSSGRGALGVPSGAQLQCRIMLAVDRGQGSRRAAPRRFARHAEFGEGALRIHMPVLDAQGALVAKARGLALLDDHRTHQAPAQLLAAGHVRVVPV